eukprot:Gb_24542 [translate_table: standard]
MLFGLNPKLMGWPIPSQRLYVNYQPCHRSSISLRRTLKAGGGSQNGGGGGQANRFLLPGATMATLMMLGALHARRLYEDKKIEEAREKGMESEFSPDFKAAFLKLLPLRSISRAWGLITAVELPIWLRPYVYRGWARAFHSNLDETAQPLEEYASLRDFFVRTLKEGSRPVDLDPKCLVSPVDGIIIRCGQLKGPGVMIEQVKGFSYSAHSLLGAKSPLPTSTSQEVLPEQCVQKEVKRDFNEKSWWRISWAAPKVRKELPECPIMGLFYCVLYLGPGDYHRVHSPVDWQVLHRRHFSGRLFPVNERAARTIRNLHVENERVVLEGKWSEGFLAMAAVGATNVGSIELAIEPELKTNRPKLSVLRTEPPSERTYGINDAGILLKKGQELAVFNLGSTVVLVFQAPFSNSFQSNHDASSELEQQSSSGFRFTVKNGDRVQMGQAIGRW